MYVKKMTYTDYDGNERTETFRFNFSRAEAAQMELSHAGGLRKHLQKIIDEKDQVAIINYFKDLILAAYGEKSDDGRRFVKSPELSKAFSETEAYSDLYLLLATNATEAAKFVNEIIPQDLEDHMKKLSGSGLKAVPNA